MIAAANGHPRLLDQYGMPLPTPPRLPRQLIELLSDRRPRLRGGYDASRTTDDFKNYWANADRYDADSANTREIREILVSRSRYEVANNGYADAIAQTFATDLVGVGPNLRMESSSDGFNPPGPTSRS